MKYKLTLTVMGTMEIHVEADSEEAARESLTTTRYIRPQELTDIHIYKVKRVEPADETPAWMRAVSA